MQVLTQPVDVGQKKEVLGKCPVCKTGNIIIHHGTFVCTNHFVNTNKHPRCSFSLSYNYRGGNITRDVVKELIENGETRYLRMSAREGSPYLCKLKIVPGKGIVPVYRKLFVNMQCPVCGGQMTSTNRSYCCENKLKKEKTCEYEVLHYLCNRFIRPYELRDTLEGGTEVLDGFRSKTSNFSGFLDMDDDFHIMVSSHVGKCPQCGGDILVGPGSFNCSNYKNGCNFKIRREYDGHLLSVGEVRELLDNNKVCISGSDIYANIISDCLTLVKDGDTFTVKKNRFVSPE